MLPLRPMPRTTPAVGVCGRAPDAWHAPFKFTAPPSRRRWRTVTRKTRELQPCTVSFQRGRLYNTRTGNTNESENGLVRTSHSRSYNSTIIPGANTCLLRNVVVVVSTEAEHYVYTWYDTTHAVQYNNRQRSGLIQPRGSVTLLIPTLPSDEEQVNRGAQSTTRLYFLNKLSSIIGKCRGTSRGGAGGTRTAKYVFTGILQHSSLNSTARSTN